MARGLASKCESCESSASDDKIMTTSSQLTHALDSEGGGGGSRSLVCTQCRCPAEIAHGGCTVVLAAPHREKQRRLLCLAGGLWRSGHTHLLGHVECGERRIPGQHDRRVPRLSQRSDDRRRVLAYRAPEGHKAAEREVRLDPLTWLLGVGADLLGGRSLAAALLVRECEHPEPLLSEARVCGVVPAWLATHIVATVLKQRAYGLWRSLDQAHDRIFRAAVRPLKVLDVRDDAHAPEGRGEVVAVGDPHRHPLVHCGGPAGHPAFFGRLGRLHLLVGFAHLSSRRRRRVGSSSRPRSRLLAASSLALCGGESGLRLLESLLELGHWVGDLRGGGACIKSPSDGMNGGELDGVTHQLTIDLEECVAASDDAGHLRTGVGGGLDEVGAGGGGGGCGCGCGCGGWWPSVDDATRDQLVCRERACLVEEAMGEASSIGHAVWLSAENLCLYEGHERCVDREGSLHGQLGGNNRCDDEDALEYQLVLRLLAFLEATLEDVRGGGDGEDEEEEEQAQRLHLVRRHLSS
mmetsp:Transcript_39315/g.78578  ORF Transcript_39315/g.78578 Transcript_39315/m.78578 type:complete len:522 (+) Transcript_39315:2319-3884(+)